MRPRLITIPISHYGERARWALDLTDVDYDETHHLQMFSWIASRWHQGSRMLPILVLSSSVTLTDSADIVRWADARVPGGLLPRDEADRQRCEALSRSFADHYGVEARRVAYEWFFRSGDVSIRYNRGRAPAWEARTLDAMMPLAKRALGGLLDLSMDKVLRGREAIDRVHDDVAERLSDGRPYLLGERFTAADLTFAAMSAPCMFPERYGVPLPRLDEVPDDAAERVRRWREHPAGRFALRLYDERPTPRGRHA